MTTRSIARRVRASAPSLGEVYDAALRMAREAPPGALVSVPCWHCSGGIMEFIAPRRGPFAVDVWGVRILSEGNKYKSNQYVKANRRDKQQRAFEAAVAGQTFALEPHDEAVVTLTRWSNGRFDSDNLASAFKFVRDGVAAWLGVDDGEARVAYEYRAGLSGVRGKYGFSVHVELWHPVLGVRPTLRQFSGAKRPAKTR